MPLISPLPPPLQIEEAYRSTPLKQQRVEVVAALRQAVRDALVEPSASAQLAAQLAAVRGEGGEHAAVSSAEESDEDRQQGAAAAAVVADVAAGAAAAGSPRYDYVTVQMALKVGWRTL